MGVESPKLPFPCWCKYRTDQYGPTNYPVSYSAVLGQQMEIFGISGLPIAMVPCLHQCNVYIKRNLQVWRAQNAISYPVQKPHRLVPSCKLPRVMQCHIGPAIKIFGLLGLPIANVPCLHQRNVYIKRKLRMWRAQKCNFFVSAKIAPTGTVLQTTPCHAAPYWASKWKFLEFRSYLSPWYRVCTNAMFILKGIYRYGEPKSANS